MHTKSLLFLALFGVLLLQTGCVVAPVIPPPGFIYNDYEAPLDYDVSNSNVATRSGRASTQTFVGLFAIGDASVNAAARNGGIRVIHGADYQYRNILGIYQEYTTIVHGE